MGERMNNKFGVPCSKLKEHIKDVDVFCTSEEQAMALAAGCWLATGKKATVYMQNSGLARCIDIITSLFMPYNIPYPNMLLSIRHSPFRIRGISLFIRSYDGGRNLFGG